MVLEAKISINDLDENCSFYKAYISKGDTNFLEIYATSLCEPDENEVVIAYFKMNNMQKLHN